MDEKVEKVVVKYKNYFEVSDNGSEEIDLDNIDVAIKTNQDQAINQKPNFLVLAVLWAHFRACAEGELSKEKSAPWERIDKKTGGEENEQWHTFLDNILDDNLLSWIEEPIIK